MFATNGGATARSLDRLAFVQSKREIEGHIMLPDRWLESAITRANGWR